MKILVIFTGGTIGSSVNQDSGFIAPDKNNNYMLLKMYNDTTIAQIGGTGGVEFETLEAYSLLSENLTGKYLTELCKILHGQLAKEYDGIVVTHGSDTLQYSAAALAYSLGKINKPIVLVCSNYILTDERANGLDNFAAAVEFIRKDYGHGVFVSYTNEKPENKAATVTDIHAGSRLLAHNAFDDRLYSVRNQWYCKLKRLQDFGYEYSKNPDYIEDCMIGTCGGFNFVDSAVDFIQAYPGLDWGSLINNMCDGGKRAVVIAAYHSGTLPTGVDSFKNFAKTMQEKGIPVYLCGSSKKTAYESAAVFDELGIKILEDMAPIAAYIYVWLSI